MANSIKSDTDAIDANFDAIADHVYMLKDRWSDEKQYEDFADYKTNLVGFFKKLNLNVSAVSKHFKVSLTSGMTLGFMADGTVRISTPA